MKGGGKEAGDGALTKETGWISVPVVTGEIDMAPNSPREEGSLDVIRHLVLLGDALQNIDLGGEQIESALVPRPRNPWKPPVLQALPRLQRGHVREIPEDATHVVISIEGAWAIEVSGLLQVGAHTISEALEALCSAADEFEGILAGMIAAARETGLAQGGKRHPRRALRSLRVGRTHARVFLAPSRRWDNGVMSPAAEPLSPPAGGELAIR